ncbi:MAG: DUF1553 domain-containing protein [Lentisphaerae bacterium]|nr:DUF1553 domain-containing protein [Lentisphaerota bacterium]MBT5611905.1 DUF1553 domain-containing protein [Lentisphaerota bacterium]MBT7055498.1 DUF1553 domain-containing protein [Lentisphaerota bacterium]MBT7847522.1 DUF1553 domain-containing protein [Lentisphaerota bacterium]
MLNLHALRFLLVGALLATGLACAAPTPSEAVSLFEGRAHTDSDNPIDRAVFDQLKQQGIQPARVCPDHVFLRRAYLDVTGTLPTAAEAKAFLRSRSRRKRGALVEHLLAHPSFADYWAMKWSDLLRVKAEFPIKLWPNAAQAYHRWIHDSIREHKPYDAFARELLTSTGSNFRVAPVNFYRALSSKEPESLAKGVALTFMGVRLDKWPEKKQAEMAGIFSYVGFKGTSEWKEEIIFFDHIKASTNAAAGTLHDGVFPDGSPARFSADVDPRIQFADWLITPENAWFTRNIANRVWYWLLGRGIIHEPDDIRPDNLPENARLLEVLQQELIGAKYDLRQLYRVILNSQAYQLSSVPADKTAAASSSLASYSIRRLDAEVLIDALNQITGATDSYSSYIPEPFTYIPEECRSIMLPDGSITSPFLEMFGRPSRDTGMELERSNAPTSAQRLHLLNSSHVYNKIINSKRLQAVIRSGRGKPERTASGLYLTILSRLPADTELKKLEVYAKTGIAPGKETYIDLAWALINSAEFFYRH